MNNSDEIPVPSNVLDALNSAQPRWLSDGMGIRGNPLQSFTGSEQSWGAADPGLGTGPESQQFDFGGSVETPQISQGYPSSSSNAAVIPAFPFQIITGTDAQGNDLAGIAYESNLNRSLVPDDSIPIAGLLTSASPDLGDSPDSGFVDVGNANGQTVTFWLYININNGAVVPNSSNPARIYTDIQTVLPFDTGAAPWTDGAFVTESKTTPPKQISAKVLIGTVDWTGKTPVIDQRLRNNLVMQNVNIAGKAALYPAPI